MLCTCEAWREGVFLHRSARRGTRAAVVEELREGGPQGLRRQRCPASPGLLRRPRPSRPAPR
eukprot:6165064-Alexandrium_andersonii.AAC.1